MAAPGPFFAVDLHGLRARLGTQCSPDPERRTGYVIGPDITGRVCHVASCRSMAEACALAEKMNKTPDLEGA